MTTKKVNFLWKKIASLNLPPLEKILRAPMFIEVVWLFGGGPVVNKAINTDTSSIPYLQLLVSADGEVALVMGILCPQPADNALEGRHVVLPLVPLSSLFTVSSNLVVRQRHRLRPFQLRRCNIIAQRRTPYVAWIRSEEKLKCSAVNSQTLSSFLYR